MHQKCYVIKLLSFYVKIIFTYINIGKDLPGECLVVFQNVDITEFKTSLSQNLRSSVGRTQQQLILNIQGCHEQTVIHSTHPKLYLKKVHVSTVDWALR